MENINKIYAILYDICIKIKPGKKMVQKLLYLIERKGVNLNLSYSMHYFGPYSSKLDNAIHILENNDMITVNTEGLTHTIEVNEFKKTENLFNKEEQEIIDSVLETFLTKSAAELEAITTLDYVATSILKDDITDSNIINKVKVIKGSKFSEDYLRKLLMILKSNKYLN